MFSAAPNPYDELVGKATDENLASEDWALNIEICDKVSGDGQNGARNAIGALQKRLSHRNPNVQLYALELANTLAQNCGKPLFEEMSSRNWTAALDRLINDRATAGPVKKKALSYVKAWAKQFEDTGDPNLGIMGELYDQLRAKNFTFDEPEPVPEDREELRRRQEDEELQRVLELSKQDKGGRNAYAPYQPSAPGAGSSSGAAATGGSSSAANAHANAYPSVASHHAQQPATSQPLPPPPQEPEPVLDLSTATRVRALYTFSSAEVGELNFERGDVIKVLDRGFKEWWRGACNGKIGIFPVTYVEAIAEPTPRELQEAAQEEARVFASLGLVDQLLQTLKSIDPSRGDRLDDRPEIEEMYQASVGLQGQINALIKKYSDQKAELEHMNANFLRAMRQYEELRNPVPQHMGQQPYGAQPDPYAQYAQYPQQQQQQQPYAQQAQQAQQYPQQQYRQEYQQQQQQQQQHQPQPAPHQAFPQAQPAHPVPGQSSSPHANGPSTAHAQAGPGGYYQQSAPSSTSVHQVPPSGAPGYPPQSPPRQNSEPGAAGIGAGAPLTEEQHRAQWDAYYRQQAEHQAQGQGQGYPTQPYPDQQYAVPQYSQAGGPTAAQDNVPQQAYGQSPYPPAAAHDAGGAAPAYGAHSGVDGVTQGMGRMGVQQ